MIAGVGIDIIEVERIARAIERYGEHFLRRIYTDAEREYCDRAHATRMLHYAARFAAKEAFSKAIGTGIARGFRFRECGVVNAPSGMPMLVLSGDLAERWAGYRLHLSLSHTQHYAAACVVIETR
ncbi:MAG: holo-[acyl-carrier-protein] synthase [Candidatus Kapaibacterium sp.]|nr:MAG: holo-[acyl-carrier-protein] synthase [Candidatus Kapabacteria bacterium]GIV56894.1 MAG: holo-[acyl-carrier-protein] synthase [Candidatus Kapabacteria bacterium]